MNRLELLKKALAKCIETKTAEPDLDVLTSIINQIEYLIDIEEGRRTDREKLSLISISVLTLRELQPGYDELSEMLYNVDTIAGTMASETTLDFRILYELKQSGYGEMYTIFLRLLDEFNKNNNNAILKGEIAAYCDDELMSIDGTEMPTTKWQYLLKQFIKKL